MPSPLFVRSVYSLLSSMCTIDGIVAKALEYGYRSVALVDKNVLAGAMSFKKAMEARGLKPIYGLECDFRYEDRIMSIALYSQNDEGFVNLMALSSFINTKDEKIIDIDDLNKYRTNNLLVLFADDMPLTYCLDKKLDVESCLNKQEECFGDYYVALADQDIIMNRQRNRVIKDLLKAKGHRVFALSRTYFLNKEDAKEYEILKCIRDKNIFNEKTFYVDEGRYLLNTEELKQYYSYDELANSDSFATLCNVKLNYKTSLPEYKTPSNISNHDYLFALCKEGLKRRLKGNASKEYVGRLKYELDVIDKMGFNNYFLIVYDFVLFAKKQGIVVAPGRGSASGSLVSYCLGITDIDPIKYGLLFERFLNPERISMPDIDTDFEDDRRDEVIEYVKNKYGIDHVGHIITYGTLKAKQVIRDVGRVLNYRTNEVDTLSKLIPYGPNMSLDYCYANYPLFKQRIESDERYRELFKIARKLEGFPRHESTHAAGIIMSQKPLKQVVPLIKIENDVYSTQYTMEYLEELGLIKMDFLSIRNLTIIKEVVSEINDFDLKNIPLDDYKTIKLISDCNVLGIFQIESNLMQSIIRRFKPSKFEDIGLIIALGRPGPMENIPQFIQNKNNPHNIKYLHKDLEPILKETYGIIVYQEQIMTIAREMAGFSYGKADVLRRAMSKKKADELEKLRNDFIDGCLKNKYEKEMAINLFELIQKFANYGFNKSHSIAYALTAYQMAYLKANYPRYFYKALLNGVIGSETKTYEYILECSYVDQKIKGISINRSEKKYLIDEDSILMPLSIVKDVGSISVNKIIEERNKNGIFKDYIDCVCRLTICGIDKNALESLIYAGAFDEFGYSRFTMKNALANVVKYANAHKDGNDIFGELDDAPVIEKLKDDKMVSAENEKSVLGFYFSFNPILEVKKQNNINTPPLKTLNGSYVKGFGLIKKIKTHRTKKGDMMAFIDINDDSGDMSLVMMPNIYGGVQVSLQKGKYIYFEGNMEKEASVLLKNARII